MGDVTARLVDALRRLDARVVPRLGAALDSVRAPRWAVRAGARWNVWKASPRRDRHEQALYLVLVVGTFAVLWVPLAVADALTVRSPGDTGPGVDRVTDGLLFVVSVTVAATGVVVSRRRRRR